MRDWLVMVLFPLTVIAAVWGIVLMLADIAVRVAY